MPFFYSGIDTMQMPTEHARLSHPSGTPSIDLDDFSAAVPKASSSTGHVAGEWHQSARIYARRKAGESRRSTDKPIVLTKSDLAPFFGTPLRNAAYHLSLCPTALKKVCRKLGIRRWPYQQQSRRSACEGFAAEGSAEPEGEGDMSSSCSASGADTVAGEQSSTNSPSEGALAEANQCDSVHSHLQHALGAGDSCSEGGLDDAAAMNLAAGRTFGFASSLRKSIGDGPACLPPKSRSKKAAKSQQLQQLQQAADSKCSEQNQSACNLSNLRNLRNLGSQPLNLRTHTHMPSYTHTTASYGYYPPYLDFQATSMPTVPTYNHPSQLQQLHLVQQQAWLPQGPQLPLPLTAADVHMPKAWPPSIDPAAITSDVQGVARPASKVRSSGNLTHHRAKPYGAPAQRVAQAAAVAAAAPKLTSASASNSALSAEARGAPSIRDAEPPPVASALPLLPLLSLDLDAEVELSRAAQRLEMEDWSELAQQMSMLRAKLESNKVNRGDSDSSACEGALDMALPQLSTCDLAYLSPCS